MPAHEPNFLFHHTVKGSEPGRYVPYAPTDACATRTVLLAEKVFVTSVEWCKTRDSPFHEFLVACVEEETTSDGHTPHRSFVSIDRRITHLSKGDRKAQKNRKEGQKDESESASEEVGEPINLKFTVNGRGLAPGETPPAPPPETTPVTTLSQSSVNSIRDKKGGLDAADMMLFSFDGTSHFVRKTQHKYNVCQTLTIQGNYLSLPQLATLARTVHEYHRSYRLPYYQCYWYAEVIYSMIKTLVNESAKNSPPGAPKPYTEQDTPYTKDLGCYKWSSSSRVTVTQSDTKAHKIIHERYHQALDEMKDVIAQVKANEQEKEQKVSYDQHCMFKC